MWNSLGWLSLTCLITLIVTLFFNYQASTGIITKLDVGEVSDKYELPITPSSWTFSIWAFIYIWQFLWIVYLLILSCKYSNKFKNNLLFGISFYIIYILSCIFNATWIIVWCNEMITAAMILLILCTISLILCAYISHRYLLLLLPIYCDLKKGNYGCITLTENDNNKKEYYNWLSTNKTILNLLYIFVLNGIPFYATWCTIASHLNIGILIVYKGISDTPTDIERNNVSVAMLSLLTTIILIYWSFDFYFFREYLKYTFSPYVTLIWAFSGVITNDYPFDSPKIFVTILLIMAIIGTIAKLIMSIFTFKKNDTAMPVNTIEEV